MLLEKRETPRGIYFKSGLIVASIVFGLLLGACLIMLDHVSPIDAYAKLAWGAFGRKIGFFDTMVKALPLILSGLGMVVAFKAHVWNIGGEGQIYVGALFSTWVGLHVTGVPTWVHLPLAIIAGGIGGAIMAYIPALLRVYLNISEVIVTLMLNYVGIYLVSYCVHGPMQEPSGFMPQTAKVLPTAIFPPLYPHSRLNMGLILVLFCAAAVYVLMQKTPLGYEIRAVGANPEGAKYGGIRVGRTMIVCMLISGFLCGLAGCNEVLGNHYRLLDGISPGYGFTAMVVALLGRLNAFGVVAAGYLFAALTIGATQMQRSMQIPLALAQVIQSLIVLAVLGSEILVRYDFLPWRHLKARLFRSESRNTNQSEG